VSTDSEEQYTMWVTALREISGQQILDAASDDEEQGAAPTNKMANIVASKMAKMANSDAPPSVPAAAAATEEGAVGLSTELSIKPRKKDRVAVRLEEGKRVGWRVRCEKYDVRFSVTWAEYPTTARTEPVGTEVTVGDPKDSKAGGVVNGEFIAPAAGQLVLQFDNTYSKMRGKKVQFSLDFADEGADVEYKLVDASGNVGLTVLGISYEVCKSST
jgi:hypothetical protein